MHGLQRSTSSTRGRSLGAGDASALLGSISRDLSSPPPPPLDHAGLGERRASEMLAKGLSALELDLDTRELEQQITSVYSGIFKLFTTHAAPNWGMPWAMQSQQTSIGTGFCIDRKRKRFITNAHCVEHAVVVQVQKRGDTKKHFAKIIAISDDCDLALLTVEADAFWEGVPDLSFSSELARLQDVVSVIGYPVGGSNISVTQGVVSRIDLTDYSQSFMTQALLTVQIDAAINPGNSGGPVLNSALEVVGVAFQGMSKQEAEGCGYIIPQEIVQHFLADVDRNGRFSGFASLGIEAQSLENDDMRELYRLTEQQTGVLVRSVAPELDVARVLQVDDVLLSVEGQQVGTDGSIAFLDGERIQVTHLVNAKYPGDQLHVEVLRAGQVLSLTYTLEQPLLLIPPKPKQLSYLIVAGLVFLPLSMQLLDQRFFVKKLGDAYVPAPIRTLELFCKYRDEEAVVLNNVLRHEVNAGYSVDDMYRLTTFNGTEVRSLAHLVQLVEGCKDEWMKFEFDGIKEMMVLKTTKVAAATQEVCEQNMIPSPHGDGSQRGGGGAPPAAES